MKPEEIQVGETYETAAGSRFAVEKATLAGVIRRRVPNAAGRGGRGIVVYEDRGLFAKDMRRRVV